MCNSIRHILYTKMTNPVTDFDIDFYMAVDGVRDLNVNANGGINGRPIDYKIENDNGIQN